jgi:hypothetical protein
MRELIKIIDLLESRGLGARKSGEEFVSKTDPDDKIYVDTVDFYPKNRPQYDNYEQMSTELKSLVNIPNATVELLGNFSQKDLAFGIAVFNRPDGTKLAYVKPYRYVKPDPTENQWENQTGIPGYRYNSRAAAKTQVGMTPQDVLTSTDNLSPDDVVNQIATKFGQDSPLTSVAASIAQGQKLPITIPADTSLSFTAFRDYFSEMLHPIALITGVYKGNAGDAARRFLGVGGFTDCAIYFGTDKTEGLSDSLLISDDGKKIKVSSKGSKGAEASAKNILDAVEELKTTDPKLYNRHSDTIELVREIKQGGQAGAPLALGIKFGIIDEEDAETIRGLRNIAPMPLEQGMAIGSDKLQKLIAGRKTDNPASVNMFYHATAAVAHKVAEYVNENTNFSKAASEILNNGALIQVYTKAVDRGTEWELQSFDTVWPSDTVTGVKFSASKTYYSTGIKGNFTFKILRGSAQDVEDERSTEPVLEPKPIAAPNVVTGKRVEIKPRDNKTVNIGREKR